MLFKKLLMPVDLYFFGKIQQSQTNTKVSVNLTIEIETK